MLNCGQVPFSIICAVVEEAQVHNDVKSVRYAEFSLFCFITKARPKQMKGVHVRCVWDLDSTVSVEGRYRPSEAAGLNHTGPEAVLLSILPPLWGKPSVILNYFAILISVQRSASQIF